MNTPSRVGLWTVVACLLASALACGESPLPTPTTPTPTPTPPPVAPPPPVGWSVSGRLVDTSTRQPIAGAEIAPTWDLTPVTTSADGSFSLGSAINPPTNPYPLAISGPNVVARRVWVGWQNGARTDVVIDAIRNLPPFSLDFYRQFVRGTFDATGAPWALQRLSFSPSFYVKTVDQNGRPIEPEVMAVVLEALPRAVSEFSAGRLATTAIETGTEPRASRSGWINVDIRRDPSERRICGFASIGANPGAITLNNDVCSCGSNKIPGSLVLHEVGHALGYFHVPDRNSVMYPILPGNCPPGQLSGPEKIHTAVAYARPRGNVDPDNDPSNQSFAVQTLRIDN